MGEETKMEMVDRWNGRRARQKRGEKEEEEMLLECVRREGEDTEGGM